MTNILARDEFVGVWIIVCFRNIVRRYRQCPKQNPIPSDISGRYRSQSGSPEAQILKNKGGKKRTVPQKVGDKHEYLGIYNP